MAALALLAAGPAPSAWAQQVQLPGKNIAQFADQLPLLTVQGGPMETLVADGSANSFTLTMQEFKASVMPTGFVPAVGTYAGTTVWGYRNTAPPALAGTYIGPVFVATRGDYTKIKFINNLGETATSNLLFWKTAVDQTLHWADPLGGEINMCNHSIVPGAAPMGNCAQNYAGPIPAVPHLHGGEVPPVLDGGPDAWFLSNAATTFDFSLFPNAKLHGHAYYTSTVAGDTAAVNEAIYRYPNSQEAAPVWFHDHLLGATRLNVYAGIAGAFVLTDPTLVLPTGLHPIGLQQGAGGAVDILIPLVLQDRMFDTNGELFFPTLGLNPEHPFWIPEFVGDTIVVNGKVWPFVNVEAKRKRFLFINGSNARTYELSLQAKGGPNPLMYVIGTDGGYLDAPAPVTSLVMMPGERYEVIVDFAGFAGKTIILKNTGRTPYPKGAPPPGTTLGQIVQFRVGAFAGTDLSYNPALATPIRTGGQQIVRLVNPTTGTPAPGVTVAKTRQLTLNEIIGPGGPLEILVNNTKWDGKRGDGSVRTDFTPITINGVTDYYSELPNEGDTEVWEIVNLTADAHPIHTHLTTFQLMNRQNFNVNKYSTAYAGAFPGAAFIPAYGPPLIYGTGNPRALGGNPDITPFLMGAPTPPLPQEAGWKDTVQALPGQVTRFVVRYAPNSLPTTTAAADLHYPFDPNASGQGYVWHCHIIDHEDNEMMRPYVVVPMASAPRTYVQGTNY
jgi:FtsP/CotA-like multicopper oxidase with cupredoxin domain